MTSSVSPDLSPETLALPKEKTYFGLMLAISLVVWLGIAVALARQSHAIGICAVIYAALIALFLWLVNGLLVARLRSEAVQVTEAQLPGLYTAHREACATLGLAEIPELYLLQSHGLLNAFATRHSGRSFVVIYSDLAEALGHDTAEARFLLGHEIGHIRRKHLLKHILLLPGSFVPMLGKAYHRACEATCDRFGTFASGDVTGAVRAMVALAAGKEAMPLVDARLFAGQYYSQRGFFVSWHELNSTYPTLTQRARNILGTADPEFRKPAGRHALAYPFAFCTLSLQGLILLYVVAILAGLSLPAMKQAMKKAKEAQATSLQHQQELRQQQQGQPSQTFTLQPPPPPAPVPADATPAPAPDPAAPPTAPAPAN